MPGEEGEEAPGKPQEGEKEGPALPGVGGPAPGGQVERGEGPGKLHLVENPGEAVAHGPEAPGPVDLHLKAAEGAAQDFTTKLRVGFGFSPEEGKRGEGDLPRGKLGEIGQSEPPRPLFLQEPPQLLDVAYVDEEGEEEGEEGRPGTHPQGGQDGEKEEGGEKGQGTAPLGL